MDLSQRKMSLGGGAGKRGRYGWSVPDRLIEDETEARTGGPGRTRPTYRRKNSSSA